MSIVFTHCRRQFGALYEKRDELTPTSLRLPGAATGGLAEAAAVLVLFLRSSQARILSTPFRSASGAAGDSGVSGRDDTFWCLAGSFFSVNILSLSRVRLCQTKRQAYFNNT
jgi:hypothetical protein